MGVSGVCEANGSRGSKESGVCSSCRCKTVANNNVAGYVMVVSIKNAASGVYLLSKQCAPVFKQYAEVGVRELGEDAWQRKVTTQAAGRGPVA